MKYRMLLAASLLSGCASVNSDKVADNQVYDRSEAVDFIVGHKANEVALKCRPRSKEVASQPDWVEECNQSAFDYLTEQENKSVEFVKEIPDKPFGMASDFTVRVLMSNPENIEGVSIGQSFEYRVTEI